MKKNTRQTYTLTSCNGAFVSGIYTCCGDPADGSSGTGCNHRRGTVVSPRRWRALSHGSVGPWRPHWSDRGSMCASGCDCAAEAEAEREVAS